MDKFFQDAKRLADDVSQNQTFYTVKPLLNFWGAFTPSEEVKRPPKSFFTLNHMHLRVALVLVAFQKGKVIMVWLDLNRGVDQQISELGHLMDCIVMEQS